jgi:HEAT repeat protein
VTALARCISPHAVHAMRTALDHRDVRVRANALEALTLADRAAIDRLPDHLDSRDNRVRANAVRAVLRCRGRDGPKALCRMLDDADPRHRVSAIWVARKAREGRVAGDLRRIADHDPVAEVRRRARATVEWIGL